MDHNVGYCKDQIRFALQLYTRRVALTRYDDVLQEEYRHYQEHVAYQKTLYGDVMPDENDVTAANAPPAQQNTNGCRKARRKKSHRPMNRHKSLTTKRNMVTKYPRFCQIN